METFKRFLPEEWKRAAKEALGGWIKQEFIDLLKLMIPIVSDAALNFRPCSVIFNTGSV